MNNNDYEQKRKQTMKFDVVAGLFLALFLINSGGPFTIAYALHLGATKSQIGILVAIPLICQIFSLLSPWLVSKFGKRKPPAIITALVGRLFWGFALYAPFLAGERPNVTFFLIGIAFSNIFISINNTIWQEWIGRIVPLEECSRYLFLRSALMTLVGYGINIIFGFWLSGIDTPLWALQLILSGCVLLSLIASFVLIRYSEPKEPVEKVTLTQTFTKPISNLNFIKVMITLFITFFSIGMSTPTATTYLLEKIQMNLGQMAIWTAITALCCLLFARFLGKIIDIAGSKSMLSLSLLVPGTLLPALYIFTDVSFIIPGYLAAIIEGLLLSAIIPSFLRLSRKAGEDKYLVIYIAFYTAIAGIGSGLGAILFGPLYNLFDQFQFVVFNIHFEGYKLLFLLIILIRLICFGIVRSIDPPNNLGEELLPSKRGVLLLITNQFLILLKKDACIVSKSARNIFTSLFRRVS